MTGSVGELRVGESSVIFEVGSGTASDFTLAQLAFTILVPLGWVAVPGTAFTVWDNTCKCDAELVGRTLSKIGGLRDCKAAEDNDKIGLGVGMAGVEPGTRNSRVALEFGKPVANSRLTVNSLEGPRGLSRRRAGWWMSGDIFNGCRARRDESSRPTNWAWKKKAKRKR
ncbi:hypothetical protein B0H16DRAFT_1465614 [Mycena metata]|uniref:Uncharacterized protein n=1 Tax=Mycena metata TaxID=1033252 RepID=A0AAD7MZD3_9AGAR|nr:hypothetical protein B0H16DRAFT_1465614 [Mycena metata]